MMQTNKGDVSVSTIVIIVIAIAVLVVGLIYAGILGEKANDIVQNVLNYITGR